MKRQKSGFKWYYLIFNRKAEAGDRFYFPKCMGQ